MLPKLSAILFIFVFASCTASVNGKSCKKICVTVRKCTDGLCDEPSYTEYSKCEIKCDSDEITGTIGSVAINRHSLSDATDEEEVTNSDENFYKINDIRDLRNDLSNNLRENLGNRKRDFHTKSGNSGSGDSDVIAILIANDDDRDIGQQARNTVYKISSIRSPTTHPFNRLHHHTSVTHLYPDHFRRFFEYFIRKMFSDNNALRQKNNEMIGLNNHHLDVIHPERTRRVKRTIGKLLLNRLSAFRAGLSAAVAAAREGIIGGSIGGGIGLKAGPGGISADISGRATSQASGYTSGTAGVVTNTGLGIRQPGLLLPGTILPGSGAGLPCGAGLSAGAAAATGGGIGGSIGGGIGLKAGPGGISADISGRATGQASGYTSGGAGIGTNTGLGIGQPGLLLPGYGAGVGTSTSVGGGLGGTVGGSLGGSLGMGLGPGLTGVRASIDGGASGQLSSYGGHQSNRWGGFGGGSSGGYNDGRYLVHSLTEDV